MCVYNLILVQVQEYEMCKHKLFAASNGKQATAVPTSAPHGSPRALTKLHQTSAACKYTSHLSGCSLSAALIAATTAGKRLLKRGHQRLTRASTIAEEVRHQPRALGTSESCLKPLRRGSASEQDGPRTGRRGRKIRRKQRD